MKPKTIAIKYLNYSSKFDDCDFSFEDTPCEYFTNDASIDEQSIERGSLGRFLLSTEEEFSKEDFEDVFCCFASDKKLRLSKIGEMGEISQCNFKDYDYVVKWENIN